MEPVRGVGLAWGRWVLPGSHWREVRSPRRAPGHALPVGGSGRAPGAVGARCGPRCAGPCAGHGLHPDPGGPLRAAGRESAFPTLAANVLASAGGGGSAVEPEFASRKDQGDSRSVTCNRGERSNLGKRQVFWN